MTLKKVHSAIENRLRIVSWCLCQSLYDVKEMQQLLCALLEIRILITNYCRFSRILKGLSQDGRQTDFSVNLRASLFNDDLLNKPTFPRSIALESTLKEILCICDLLVASHHHK